MLVVRGDAPRRHAGSLLHNVRVNAPSNQLLAEKRLNQGVARERLRSAESNAPLSASWCIA